MNFASWVILAIVVALVGLAIKATFFKKKGVGGSCCDVGDVHRIETTDVCDGSSYRLKMASGACGSCTACHDNAVAHNAVEPVIKPLSQSDETFARST